MITYYKHSKHASARTADLEAELAEIYGSSISAPQPEQDKRWGKKRQVSGIIHILWAFLLIFLLEKDKSDRAHE